MDCEQISRLSDLKVELDSLDFIHKAIQGFSHGFDWCVPIPGLHLHTYCLCKGKQPPLHDQLWSFWKQALNSSDAPDIPYKAYDTPVDGVSCSQRKRHPCPRGVSCTQQMISPRQTLLQPLQTCSECRVS